MPKLLLIHALQHIQLHSLQIGRYLRVLDVAYGCLLRGNTCVSDWRTLKGGRQERAGPILHSAMPQRGTNADKPGKALVLCSQPIGYPRANTWPYKRIGPRVKLQQRPAVRRIVPMERADHAHIIHALPDIREQIAHLDATLPVLLELPG